MSPAKARVTLLLLTPRLRNSLFWPAIPVRI
jgi:hypothetical protein